VAFNPAQVSAAGGQLVTLLSNGVGVGTATLTAGDVAAGFVDITASTLGADGVKSLTATIRDNAGNASEASTALSIVLDRVAATQAATITGITTDTGASASDGVTSDTSLTVSGTISAALAAGERVQVLDGATLLGNATVTDTTWSFVDSRTLADAQVVAYTARVADAAGNPGTASAVFTATIDTSAPTTTVTIAALVDDAGLLVGDRVSGATTDDTNVSIRGTLSAPSRRARRCRSSTARRRLAPRRSRARSGPSPMAGPWPMARW